MPNPDPYPPPVGNPDTPRTGFLRVLGAVFASFIGIALNFTPLDPVKALFWSAVINGLLAPFLLVGILIVASDRKIMKGQPISRLSRAIIGTTAALMFAAAIGMFVL